MTDETNRNPVPNNQNPDAPVGITNRDKEIEDSRLARQQETGEAQMSGDAPVGTHQGATLDEMESTSRPADAGYESERGADIANSNLDQ